MSIEHPLTHNDNSNSGQSNQPLFDNPLRKEFFTFDQVEKNIVISQSILRLPTVISCSGLSRSSIYLRIAQGLWPKPVSLGARAVGWPANEVAMINAARIAGKSNEEVRQLVVKLEAARKVFD